MIRGEVLRGWVRTQENVPAESIRRRIYSEYLSRYAGSQRSADEGVVIPVSEDETSHGE